MSVATVVTLALLFTPLLATGSSTESVQSECPALDFQDELRRNVNPASLLEGGQYLFEDNKPLPKSCLRQRVCEVDEFTRLHYGQSYYISLNEPGGVEIERQFPDLVKALAKRRGDTRMIYLNEFCRNTEITDEGVPPN